MTDQTCPCHAEPEYAPTLVAEENDAVDAIEAAHVAMVRAGINVANSRAYIRALNAELTETMNDLNHAHNEFDELEREFQGVLGRYLGIAEMPIVIGPTRVDETTIPFPRSWNPKGANAL
jgi:hypothetical protein